MTQATLTPLPTAASPARRRARRRRATRASARPSRARATAARRAPAPSDDRRRRLPGASSRKIRSTGWPSSDSKSIGRSSRANRPTSFSSFGSLPCGIAMPLPTPVLPSFSRCISVSKISRSFCPVSLAARAESSWIACFLPFTLSAGIIAFGATRSVSGMQPVRGEWRGLLMGRRRFIGAAHRVNGPLRGRVDPSDIAVGPAINQVDPAVAGVPEHHDRRAGHVQFHHRLADRELFQHRRRLRDDDRIELGHLVVAVVRRRLDHIARRIDADSSAAPPFARAAWWSLRRRL